MVEILRPSSADIWSNCAGQPQLVERLGKDELPSDPAMEGTCAAWLAEQVLTGQAATCRELVGTVCPENNWPIDHIMANHIQKYVDMIVNRGGDIKAERRVYLNEFINGTPDAYATITWNKPTVIGHPGYDGIEMTTLYCDDLKYGYGIVEPTSKQVLIYAAAIAWAMYHAGSPPDVIQIGIYQPRGYHVDGIYRTRQLTFQQLTDEAHQIIEDGKKCFDPNAQLTPGSHCKHCPIAASCSALSHELYTIYTMLAGREQRHMTGDEMSIERRFIEMVEDMIKGKKSALDAEMNARMDAGEYIPGWDRQQGYGNRRYKDNIKPETIHFFTGIDPTHGKMVTPAQMERNGANPDILDMFTETPRTKAKFVPITSADIARQFGK